MVRPFELCFFHKDSQKNSEINKCLFIHIGIFDGVIHIAYHMLSCFGVI